MDVKQPSRGKTPNPSLCMGVKHAQALLTDPVSEHCCAMLIRILEHRLHESAASKANPCFSDTMVMPSDKPAKASTCYWECTVYGRTPWQNFPLCSASRFR